VLDLHNSEKSYKQLRAMSRKMDQMESAELTVRHKPACELTALPCSHLLLSPRRSAYLLQLHIRAMSSPPLQEGETDSIAAPDAAPAAVAASARLNMFDLGLGLPFIFDLFFQQKIVAGGAEPQQPGIPLDRPWCITFDGFDQSKTRLPHRPNRRLSAELAVEALGASLSWRVQSSDTEERFTRAKWPATGSEEQQA
jgi:hypothetical protein